MTSYQKVFPRVFNALTQREGKKVTLPTLVSLTGLTETQVQATIANARRTNETYAQQIEVVKFGREWRFNANATSGNNYPSVEEVEKAVAVGAPHIWKRVLVALTRNEGKIMSRERLAEIASTDESPVTPQQAANAMLTIMRQPIIGQKIEVINAGRNWRYRDSERKVEAKREPSGSIRGSLLRYFQQRPGDVVMIDEVAKDLGFTPKQVQNGMYNLTVESEATSDLFVVVQRGNAWQYKVEEPAVSEPVVVTPAVNGHVPGTLSVAPSQVYTPQAITTTLPVSSVVPNIPPAQPAAQGVATAVVSEGRLFEEIAQLPGNAILIKESETGAVYRATPLA